MLDFLTELNRQGAIPKYLKMLISGKEPQKKDPEEEAAALYEAAIAAPREPDIEKSIALLRGGDNPRVALPSIPPTPPAAVQPSGPVIDDGRMQIPGTMRGFYYGSGVSTPQDADAASLRMLSQGMKFMDKIKAQGYPEKSELTSPGVKEIPDEYTQDAGTYDPYRRIQQPIKRTISDEMSVALSKRDPDIARLGELARASNAESQGSAMLENARRAVPISTATGIISIDPRGKVVPQGYGPNGMMYEIPGESPAVGAAKVQSQADLNMFKSIVSDIMAQNPGMNPLTAQRIAIGIYKQLVTRYNQQSIDMGGAGGGQIDIAKEIEKLSD